MGVSCSSEKAVQVQDDDGKISVDVTEFEYPHKVLMLGPNGAGKTHLLYSWKLDCENVIEPLKTEEFNVEQVRLSDDHSLLVVFDLNGSPNFRTRRRQFYQGAEGIVYMVDSADLALLNEAKQDLIAVMHERDLADIPLLIIANKQDLADAMPLCQLEEVLGLRKFVPPRRWQMIGICSKKEEDAKHALDIMTKLILNEEIDFTDSDIPYLSPRQKS